MCTVVKESHSSKFNKHTYASTYILLFQYAYVLIHKLLRTYLRMYIL